MGCVVPFPFVFLDLSSDEESERDRDLLLGGRFKIFTAGRGEDDDVVLLDMGLPGEEGVGSGGCCFFSSSFFLRNLLSSRGFASPKILLLDGISDVSDVATGFVLGRSFKRGRREAEDVSVVVVDEDGVVVEERCVEGEKESVVVLVGVSFRLL